MARPFDAATRRAIGDPFPLAEQVSVNVARAAMSVSATGVLGYWRGGGLPISRLTWTDRSGKTISVVGEPAAYSNLSLSPDERRVAVALTAGAQPNRDIWVIDLAREDTATRLTFDAGQEGDPIWSPDGSQIVFNSNRSGFWNSGFQRPADGSGDDVPLVTMEQACRFSGLVARRTLHRVHRRREAGDERPLGPPAVRGSKAHRVPANAIRAKTVRPSRQTIAGSRTTRMPQGASRSTSVRFPAPGASFRSRGTAAGRPNGAGDGKELFFLALDGTMMAADVALGQRVQAAVPRALFPTPAAEEQRQTHLRRDP